MPSRRPNAKMMAVRPDEDRYRTPTFRARAFERRDALLRRLRTTYAKDGLALYLGAGVSASAYFPAWAALIQGMFQRVLEREAYGGNEERYEKENRWPWRPDTFNRALSQVQLGNNRPLIMLARLLRNRLKRRLPDMVAGALYFGGPIVGQYLVENWGRDFARGKASIDPEMMSSDLINAIADIAKRHRGAQGVRAIVNYNFDDMVDEVIRTTGTRCVTMSSPADHCPPAALPCYHVHGVLPLREYAQAMHGVRRGRRARGDFVFSEEQYHRQYAEPFRWSNLIQTSLLGSSDGLFVGLSLEDPNIRRLLDATHRQYPRRRNYAILKRQRPLARARNNVREVVTNLLEEIESDGFADIGVDVLWVDDFKEIPQLVREIAKGK